MSTLEGINRRLSQQQFIRNPADERFFGELIGEIRGMAERHRRDIEKDLPSPNEAGAWKKAWAIREAFIRLEAETKPDLAARERTLAVAATEEWWNDHLRRRDKLIELIRIDRISPQMREYAGLEPGDLDQPISDDPEIQRFGGRKPGWQDVARRISTALGKLQGMSDSERALIPHFMAQRRLETENRELRKRLTALEAKIESIEPTHQENAA